uniref:Uncharacterized protein n=1 Tax=Lactuca sativa TaxID=4236 RepID=A0A9R1X4L4_LACSA|nr:hypothetical protein LSAT_V11C600335500 [Lactuca sativa]
MFHAQALGRFCRLVRGCDTMENLQEWKEPLAYRRFCLRHITSNFMKRYTNFSLKNFCWTIGSATQKRKFSKKLKLEAWKYLKKINKSQWCLLYDENRRWGILTTNISDIRCGEQDIYRLGRVLTLHSTELKYNNVAMNCNTPLQSRMRRLFCNRDTRT